MRRASPQSCADQDEFVPFAADTLDAEAMVGCDLYRLVPPNRYVLYLAADSPVARDLQRDLARRSLANLYVRAPDAGKYAEYLVARIETVGAGPDRSPEQQAHVVLESTHFLMERAFHDVTTESVRQLHDAVTAMMDLAMSHPGLPRSLLLLTHHDAYTYNHSVNVTVFGCALALSLGGDPQWLRGVAQGLSVHDIGKTRVPLSILNARGALTDEQWRIMRQHPAYGVQILNELGLADDPLVVSIVGKHHVRNGPKEARLCAICDVFDALTTDRPYRKASGVYEGLTIMVDEMVGEFDSDLFSAFVLLFMPDDYPRTTRPSSAPAP